MKIKKTKCAFNEIRRTVKSNYDNSLTPKKDNVKSPDIIEYSWSLPVPQLRGLIQEVREYGFSRLAAELDAVLDEKLNWGAR